MFSSILQAKQSLTKKDKKMYGITAIDLKEKLDRQEVLLIDVREPEEYAREFIEGAHLIPLGNLSLKDLPKTDLPIVFYCALGRRSQEACRKIHVQDSTLVVYSLERGIGAWKDHGFSVSTGASVGA